MHEIDGSCVGLSEISELQKWTQAYAITIFLV